MLLGDHLQDLQNPKNSALNAEGEEAQREGASQLAYRLKTTILFVLSKNICRCTYDKNQYKCDYVLLWSLCKELDSETIDP